MKKLKLYWNERYQSLADDELSWTEDRPDLSLEWIESLQIEMNRLSISAGVALRW